MMSKLKAHKTMTPEEYAAMPVVGWHMVCRDYDGAGGVGVRFISYDLSECSMCGEPYDGRDHSGCDAAYIEIISHGHYP